MKNVTGALKLHDIQSVYGIDKNFNASLTRFIALKSKKLIPKKLKTEIMTSNDDQSKNFVEIRGKVLDKEKEILADIAGTMGCYQHGKKSISQLLTDIASGDISLTRTETEGIKKAEIQLRIKVSVNLIGIFLKITEILKKEKMNIISIQTNENSNYADIYLNINKDDNKDIVELATKISKLKIRDVFDFNKNVFTKLKLITEYYQVFPNLSIEEMMNRVHRDKLIQMMENNIINQGILEYPLITDVYYVFQMYLSIKDKVGTLNELLDQISRWNISIDRANVTYPDREDDRNYNSVLLTLSYFPLDDQTSENNSQANKIYEIVDRIERIKSKDIKKGSIKLSSLHQHNIVDVRK